MAGMKDISHELQRLLLDINPIIDNKYYVPFTSERDLDNDWPCSPSLEEINPTEDVDLPKPIVTESINHWKDITKKKIVSPHFVLGVSNIPFIRK